MIDERSHHSLCRGCCCGLRMGLMFLAHGALLKLGTFGLAGTMGFFGRIGYPPVLGAVVIAAEILGGLALIAGIGVRVVSLALVPLMLGATAAACRQWLAVQRHRRRLGIPRLLDGGAAGAGGARRRRLGAADRRPAGCSRAAAGQAADGQAVAA